MKMLYIWRIKTQKLHVHRAKCTQCIKKGPGTRTLHAPPFLPPTTLKQANTPSYEHVYTHACEESKNDL